MSIFKKVVAGLSATTIALSVVAPVSTVSANSAEVEAANKLAANGIIKKQDNAAGYNLENEITRREFIKVVANLGKLNVTDTCEGKFEDLSSTDWGCKYAEAALKAGYISGNAKFNPDMNVSKWEAMKMILKANGLNKSEGFESFEAAYVDAAVKAGYVDTFTDYATSAKRGWLFVAGANSTEEKEVEQDLDLCKILGTCPDEDKKDETTTPVVDKDEDKKDETTTPVVSTENELQVSLNPKNPENGTRIPKDTPRVEFMVFDVTAGSEDVELETVKFEAAGFGASSNIDDVVVYNEKGEKITRQRSVNSDDEAELDFKNEFTVKAGTTETLTVTAQVNGGTNGDVYALNMVEFKASSNVEGASIKGSDLEAVTINNQGKMVIKADKASKDVTIGEESKLGGFKLKNDNDKEDISVKTMRFKQIGTIDEDNISDVELLADGKVVVSDMDFNKEYITANFGEGYVLPKDKSSYVTFELRGTVIGDPTKSVQFQIEESDDIFAVGVKNGYNTPVLNTGSTAFAGSENISDALTVEGANVKVEFVRAEKDEVSADTDDFVFGTLKLESFSGNYNIKKMTAKVTYTGTNGQQVTNDDLLENVKLGNVSVDNETTTITTGSPVDVNYVFEDLFLKKGEAKEYVVTADVKKTAKDVKFQIDLTFKDDEFEIEDEDNDETYTKVSPASGAKLADIFSAYSGLDSRSVEVKDANLEITRESISNEDVVLGDSTILVLKGDIEAGSAEDVKLNSLTFTNSATAKVDDIDKVIAKAFLKIGSETIESTDISATEIKFTGISKVIKAGSSNKADFELSVKFKKADDSAITANTKDEVSFTITSNEAEGVDTGNDVTGANFTVPSSSSNTVTLATKGAITVDIDVDQDDANVVLVDKARIALAGSNNVVLAKVELDSDKEDVKIKDLTFLDTGSTNEDGTKLEDSFTNVRLVKSDLNTLIANANTSVVNGGGTNQNWQVRFEDISNFEVDTEGKTVIYVIADVKKIDEGEQGGNSVSGASVELAISASEYEGVNSVETITASSATTAKSVTIAASDLASVEVNTLTTKLTGSTTDVAEIIVTPTSSSNIDDQDKTIKALLESLTLKDVAPSNYAITSVELRDKDNTSQKLITTISIDSADSTPANRVKDVAFTANQATPTEVIELDGTTTIVVTIKGSEGANDKDSNISFELNRENVKFLDGSHTRDGAGNITSTLNTTEINKVYNKNASIIVQ